MYSVNNDQNKAMKFLHQGQLLSSNKLLYRFNHGIIMFKLGLLHQAKLDFEAVCLDYPKEFIAHFNHSLCLFQLGHYESTKTAIDGVIKMMLDAQTSSKGIDYNLLRDAHMLKAQCYWRTNQPIEAVKSFG
jgi:tetratricopeptide (TPR) repeat protein